MDAFFRWLFLFAGAWYAYNAFVVNTELHSTLYSMLSLQFLTMSALMRVESKLK